MPVLMSIEEVAKATGLSRSTVKKAIKLNELPSKKYGRRRLIRSVDFEKWVGPVEADAITADRSPGSKA